MHTVTAFSLQITVLIFTISSSILKASLQAIYNHYITDFVDRNTCLIKLFACFWQHRTVKTVQHWLNGFCKSWNIKPNIEFTRSQYFYLILQHLFCSFCFSFFEIMQSSEWTSYKLYLHSDSDIVWVLYIGNLMRLKYHTALVVMARIEDLRSTSFNLLFLLYHLKNWYGPSYCLLSLCFCTIFSCP